MLTALIEERHDDVDTMCLAGSCSDDTLQILIVVIRRVVVLHTAELVGHAPVGDIGHEIQIKTTNRLIDDGLCFAGSETGVLSFDEVRMIVLE